MADLDAGVASYEKLGLECTQRMSNEDLGIHQAILPLADGGFIELVSPISDDSPVGKALARDGEGMHTIAFRATPLDEACEVIKASGATLIGEGGPQVFVRACPAPPPTGLCALLCCCFSPRRPVQIQKTRTGSCSNSATPRRRRSTKARRGRVLLRSRGTRSRRRASALSSERALVALVFVPHLSR